MESNHYTKIDENIIKQPKKTILADTVDYRIVYHDIGVKSTVISFAYWNLGIADEGFGTEFCLKNGYNNIYVSGKNDDWFQSLSAEEFCSSVNNIIEDQTVITYGVSLGGYAAIYYGSFVNALIVAASPRNFFHPITAGNSDNFKHQSFSDIPNPTNSPIVILDPFDDIDHKFYTEAIIPGFDKVKSILIENAGHETLASLANARVLKSFIIDLFDGKIPKVSIGNNNKAEYLKRVTSAKVCEKSADTESMIRQLLYIANDSESRSIAINYSLKHGVNMNIENATRNQIQVGLESLDKKFGDYMLVDVIMILADRLYDIGAYDLALEQYTLAEIKWAENEHVKSRIKQLKEFIKTKEM